jgi:hypothetical protein
VAVAGLDLTVGAALTTLGAPLAIVAGWGAVSFVIALQIFRWR